MYRAGGGGRERSRSSQGNWARFLDFSPHITARSGTVFCRSQAKKQELTKRMAKFVHVRYILTWLRGLQDKLSYLVLFSLYSSHFWELREKEI